MSNIHARGHHNSTAAQAVIGAVANAAANPSVNPTSHVVWMEPNMSLWVKACIAAGKSVGMPGCPSREEADLMLAVLGA
jgi:hypothetical protein